MSFASSKKVLVLSYKITDEPLGKTLVFFLFSITEIGTNN